MNDRIGITGASGYIGSALTTHLRKAGFNVTAFCRANLNERNNPDEKYYSIADIESQADLAGIDILIHNSWILGDASRAGINLTGTKKLFDAARINGVKWIIFISSVSAHPSSTTAYGRSKLEAESLLDLSHHTVVSPGLVIGNGGLYKKLATYAIDKKIVPLIDSGIQPIQYIGIDELCLLIEKIISKKHRGKFIAASEEVLTYREMFQIIASQSRKKIKFIHIPSSLLRGIIKLSRWLRMSLPVNEDQVNSLSSMKALDSSETMKMLNMKIRPINQTISRFLPLRK